MKRKTNPVFTAAVTLLLLSTYVMGHNYVAHDYLHGRGDAAISIAMVAGLIAATLGLFVGVKTMRSGKGFSGIVYAFLGEDKAPPMATDSRKSREELREELKLRQKKHKEGRRIAIREYIDIVMVPFLDDSSLDLLYQNIRHWHFSDDEEFKPEPLSPHHNLSAWDIRHFVWNIGERLGWDGVKRAQFAKYCFPVAMKDLEVETIRRTLKQSPTSPCAIDIDEPDGKNDYHFHYSEDD